MSHSLIERRFLQFKPHIDSKYPLTELLVGFQSTGCTGTDQAKFNLLTDLASQGHRVIPRRVDKDGYWFEIESDTVGTDKVRIRSSLEKQRLRKMLELSPMIQRTESKILNQFASANEVLHSQFKIGLEVCESRKQSDLFRYCRLFSSIPYKDYVGRRIRILVRDLSFPHRPIIGIIALGSPVINLAARNAWVGWQTGKAEQEHFMSSLNRTMDMYVAITIPPYNYLLCGKLLCYIAASNEIREIVTNKYKHKGFDQLPLITTTSFFGRSAVYNRISYRDQKLFIPVGFSSGFGSIHLSGNTVDSLKSISGKYQSDHYNNGLDVGKNHIFHHLEGACRSLKLNPRSVLSHGISREVFVTALATNSREYLNGTEATLQPFDFPLKDLVDFWKKRWLKNRLARKETILQLNEFRKESLRLTKFLD